MKTPKIILTLALLTLIAASASAQIPVFRDIAAYARVNNGDLGDGAAFLDVNNDGYYDIHLINDCQPYENDHLYLNQGNLTFRDITALAGVKNPPFSNCVRVADLDNDGWQDMMITTANMIEFSRLYHNNGDCTFTDIFPQSGLLNTYYIGCDWGDINNDGFVDLFLLSEYVATLCGLWYNTGFGTYSLVFNPGGSYAFGCDAQFCDFDNDRDLDLFMGVYGYDRLYLNDAQTFRDIATAAGVAGDFWDFSYPIIGDYNNDGLFDIFVLNAQEYVNSPDCLYRQTDTLTFTNVIDSSGIDPEAESTCSGVWGDFDNDGWLDLIVFAYYSTHFWHNNGDGTFSDVAHQAGLGNGSDGALGPALGDINNDGFLDLYLPRYGYNNQLFLNGGNSNHWLQVTLVGTASNRLGIGARAKAVAGDLVQWRDLGGGKSVYSSNAPFIHFGLGLNTTVDSLYIFWPSGNTTILTNVPADQRISVTEVANSAGLESPVSAVADNFFILNIHPNPFNNVLTVNLKISTPGNITLSVYNIEGKRVAEIANSYFNAGDYQFQFGSQGLSSGEYFIHLKTAYGNWVQKAVLIK